MGLQFVFGPSGSGKSYQLYQTIIRESVEHPEQNFIVLVPEQFTMQTQKDLVAMHPCHGIMNIDVLSFGRLAYRVFEETGGGNLPVLDDEGKNLILRRIAGKCENQLQVLKGNMKKLGYISEVKSILSEFTQYDIEEKELEQVMEAAGSDTRLYYKLQDLSLLYREFTAYLKKRYITKEELLDVLSREVEKSEILRNSTVVLDGFTGFTPVQNRLLLELMSHCRRICVTVTMDERENPYTYSHPYQMFALSKHMVSSLVKIAKEANVELLDPVQLYGKPVARFRNNPPMAFLEQNIFRHQAGRYHETQDTVCLYVARNPREEALAVAGRIRYLVRVCGYRYREIGVIISDMNAYGDYLKRAFELYEIPVFLDQKKNILLNSFVEYIRSLLNMAEQNFSYESVFRFLRTDLSEFTREETDRLENYVIGLGIKGYKKWQEKWIRKLNNMSTDELELMNSLRIRLVEKTEDLLCVLKQRRKTVADITEAVYHFMVREKLQQKLKKREEMFQNQGQLALAREFAQVYRIVIELFDKFVELLGDEMVSLQEYLRLLDAGLEEARVGVVPPSPDQVVAGDMERTRLKDIRALLFVGANDVYLPGSLIRTGLLSERDRAVFRKEKLDLSACGKEKAYIQKFYLYMNLTKPSEKLEIFYSKVSSEGKSLRPSYLVQEIRRLFPDLKVRDEEDREFCDREWTEILGMTEIIRGLRNLRYGTDNTWKELYGWYRSHPQWSGKMKLLLEAGFYHHPTDSLTKAVAKKLYGEEFESSITRAERFSACAFAHFLNYGLRLQKRQEYEFQAVDLGNVCHEALQKFSEKLVEKKKTWTELTSDETAIYIEESVEEAVTGYGNDILYSTARDTYMIYKIKKLLERTVWALKNQLAAGDFQPIASEMRFRGGKIDRVDICEDDGKIYVKVLDYKTGSKSFDVVALYHGLQLQLMVYLDAAVELIKKKYPGREVIPAGVFYYRILDPLVEKQPDEQIEKAILKELKPDGMINLKDEVLEHLDHNKEGESLAVPVKYNKNGSLSKASKAVPEEVFKAMMNHAAGKVEEIRREILSGKIEAIPYRRGQETGCDYCSFRHVCGFDIRLPGCMYRDIGNMTTEEAIAAMEGEEKRWE